MPRFHCPGPLATGATLSLPPGTARHVQVLRHQPGDALTLFDGRGGEYDCAVLRMGRNEVEVQVGAHTAVEREAPQRVVLAVGMPANERMDWLVEKATELGAAGIQPLATARTVLRLKGERADKKIAHWQAVAVAACEQCGRNRVPAVAPVADLSAWLASLPPLSEACGPRLLLSLHAQAVPLAQAVADAADLGATVTVLSGPEGGLAPEEEAAALAAGFKAVRLGAQVLRAETAPLAVLARLAL
ncbi:16S rRNA (uracil(1498)-N(3))-methyltransferase [Xylophilus ampelinus]|uniref:Ribosomal RNA small subunit methyltransferase E n=1 Tax=Xylophilus ampelinus TaxID=54067 RepID=A0A318SFQ9_9BURK|nr:16S rRNA (uracil(1498)-N(3))-methyltransferase [Xylophilus ampelinus]MCS4511156.1 16S rRNA (uracil(1498)-N(3))-methyltransferase [Xylophilus ampelinus]PYE75091.1 16S rRNA (uracil1498-N3)-methyltransferase [Xylophilus ampelinus]